MLLGAAEPEEAEEPEAPEGLQAGRGLGAGAEELGGCGSPTREDRWFWTPSWRAIVASSKKMGSGSVPVSPN